MTRIVRVITGDRPCAAPVSRAPRLTVGGPVEGRPCRNSRYESMHPPGRASSTKSVHIPNDDDDE